MNYILAAFGIVLASSAHAQVSVSLGPSFATLAPRQQDTYRSASADGQLGYHLGLGYEHQLGPRFALYSELQFSRQRVQLVLEDRSIADGGYTGRYKLGISYLHLPVLLRANIGPAYVEAGPQASFSLAAHEKGTESLGRIWGSYDYSFDRRATDHYRRFDGGLAVGAGIRLGKGFGLGARASAGLVSVTHFNQPLGDFRGELKNRAVQASISYQLKSGS